LIRFVLIFFFFLTTSSYSEIKKIDISGNVRVNSNTIETLVDKKNKNVDSIYINELTKKIYDTDFFSDVKISFSQDVLKIVVIENPVVNFFYINGLEEDDLKEINKITKLKENIIFSTAKLKNDTENILAYLKSRGYFNSTVNPEVIKIENSQINLIYNINKNQISKIENIFFIGKKFFKDSILIDVISSKEDSWWKIFTASPFSEENLEYDKILLKNFYKSRGFYDVQIESAFASITKNNNFSLTFVINSGNKFNFAKAEIKTNNTIIKKDDINELSKLANDTLRNKVYSPAITTKTYNKLNEYLEKKKYNNFEIIIDELKLSESDINLVVQVNDRKKSLIGRINFYGNNITEEKVIRDKINIVEGDYLDLFKLRNSVDNIKSAGLFRDINYKIIDSDRKDFKNLDIFVKEKPTGSISAGAGYGSSGFMVETSVNEANFLGKGINLNAVIRATKERINGDFTYIEPNYRNSSRDLILGLYSERNDYENAGYTNTRAGTRIGTRYEIYEDVFLRPLISLQYDSVSTTASASSLLKKREGDYITNSIGYNISFDQRNSKFNPTSGYILSFEQNHATFLSDVPNIETGFNATIFQEILEDKSTGSVKLRLANVSKLSTDSVKISDRLYTSNYDIKGFETRGIGPVDGGDHVGGNNLATLSFKSSFPNFIPNNFKSNSYLFYDLGNVWGVDYSDTISVNNKLRSSAGLGLDITTPIGPVSFIYALPITKSSTDKEQRFVFNIGSSF